MNDLLRKRIARWLKEMEEKGKLSREDILSLMLIVEECD